MGRLSCNFGWLDRAGSTVVLVVAATSRGRSGAPRSFTPRMSRRASAGPAGRPEIAEQILPGPLTRR